MRVAHDDFGPHYERLGGSKARMTREDREEMASRAFRRYGPDSEDFKNFQSYLSEERKRELASWAFQMFGPESPRFRLVEAQYTREDMQKNAPWAFHTCGHRSPEFTYIKDRLSDENWRELAREAFKKPDFIDSDAFKYVEPHLTDDDRQLLAPWAFTNGLHSAQFRYIEKTTGLNLATKRNIASQAFAHGLDVDTKEFIYVEAYLDTKEKRQLAERSLKMSGSDSPEFRRVEHYLDKETKKKLATWAFSRCGLDSDEFKYFERYLSMEEKLTLAQQAFDMHGPGSTEFHHFMRDATSRQALLEQRILEMSSSKEVNTWLEGCGENSRVPSSATLDDLIQWLTAHGVEANRNVIRVLSSRRQWGSDEKEAQHVNSCTRDELQHLVVTQNAYSLAPAVFSRLSDDPICFEFEGNREVIPKDLFSCRSGFVGAALRFERGLDQQQDFETDKNDGLSKRWEKLVDYFLRFKKGSNSKRIIRLISPVDANEASWPRDKDNFRFIASFISNHPDNVDWDLPFSLERVRQLADAWLIEDLLTFEDEDLDFARRRQQSFAAELNERHKH